MIKNKNCYLLIDHIIGHKNQIMSLAEELDCTKYIIDIKYNILSNLPSFLLRSNIHIDNLGDYNYLPKPDIIIACGRKTLPLLLYYKRKYGKGVLAIYIMKPKYGHNLIDLMIMPSHDYEPQLDKFKDKIIYLPLSLNNVYNKLQQLRDRNIIKFNNYNPKKIALLIGGTYIDNNDIEKIFNIISQNYNRLEYSLLITTSRRTSSDIIDFIIKNIKDEDYFFCYNEEDNPYYNILNEADIIIVTGDSISMISDSISANKPVYILQNNQIPRKHLLIHNDLFIRKIAYNLKYGINSEKINYNTKSNDVIIEIKSFINKKLTNI